mgnify:CR=1 FL=1
MKQFLLAGAAIWAVFAAPALAGDINPAKIAEHVKEIGRASCRERV